MSYTKITAEDTAEITDLLQQGDINAPKQLSGSKHRLGASQPIFYQTGTKADNSTLILTKVVLTKELAISLKAQLEFCQGRSLKITDKDGKVWSTIFCHTSVAGFKRGSGYLVECTMVIEALPGQTLVGATLGVVI